MDWIFLETKGRTLQIEAFRRTKKKTELKPLEEERRNIWGWTLHRKNSKLLSEPFRGKKREHYGLELFEEERTGRDESYKRTLKFEIFASEDKKTTTKKRGGGTADRVWASYLSRERGADVTGFLPIEIFCQTELPSPPCGETPSPTTDWLIESQRAYADKCTQISEGRR